jgi:hypothetical protein
MGGVPKALEMYLKNEIDTIVPWRVEILNESVAAEIAALPADMQARFLRLRPHCRHRFAKPQRAACKTPGG